MHFLSVAQSKYTAKAGPQFARRIEEERPPLARSRITDDWFVLLDVASGESGILFTNLPVAFFCRATHTCDASFASPLLRRHPRVRVERVFEWKESFVASF